MVKPWSPKPKTGVRFSQPLPILSSIVFLYPAFLSSMYYIQGEKMLYYIYKTTNLINNKYYIGKHQTTNLNDKYIGSGKLLKKAIKKYGKENFKFEILEFCNNLSELNELEKTYVNEQTLKDPLCYNMKLGGQGGWDFINTSGQNGTKKGVLKEKALRKDKNWLKQWNEKRNNAKAKISKEALQISYKKISHSLKEYYKTHETPFKNKKHSQETKLKISKKLKNLYRGEKNPMYGKHWIYNIKLKQNLVVNNSELEKYLNEGWILGRKIKF